MAATLALTVRLLLGIAITLLPLLTTTDASPPGFTLDFCKLLRDCTGNRFCATLVGSTDDKIAQCVPGISSNCFCWPHPKTIQCSSSESCPPEEVCAIASNSVQPFCISCNYMKENGTGTFTLTDKTDPQCDKHVNAKPSPAPSFVPTLPKPLSFDFCTPEVNCATPGLECKLVEDGFFRYCSLVEHPSSCTCRPKTPTNCTSSTKCPAGEVCVRNTRLATKHCTSCRITAQLVHLIPLSPDAATCNQIPPPPPPVYAASPNGLSFDDCNLDVQCQGDRSCRVSTSGNYSPPCAPGVSPCICAPAEFQACASSTECEDREVCALFKGTTTSYCVSANLVSTMGPNEALEIGSRATNPPLHGPKLSGENCRFDWDCASGRRCTHARSVNGGCAGRDACTCEPELFKTPCRRDNDCPDEEWCVNVAGARSRPFCRARTVVERNRLLVREGAGRQSSPGQRGPQQETPLKVRLGLPGDVCRSDEGCADGVVCRHVTEENGSCNGRPGCECKYDSPHECTVQADCTEGAICASVKDDVTLVGECRSRDSIEGVDDTIWTEFEFVDYEARREESAMPSSEASEIGSLNASPSAGDEVEREEDEPSDETAVCVDAEALWHLSRRDLVFTTHRRASVLCDMYGSCATRGHVVVWSGRAMMMKSYCAEVGTCRRRSILVNSPRMGWRGMRIPSRTQGLMFTPFAGRFESRVEEAVLSAIVHLGF